MHRIKPVVISLSGVAALGLAAVTLAGYLAPLHWLFDLVANFRVQALLAGSALALGLALLRAGGWLSIVALLLALNAVPVAPYYLPAPPVAAPGTPLRVMTINILRENRQAAAIEGVIVAATPDVVALQELTPAMLPLLDALRPTYPHQFVRAQDNHFGIALLSRLPLDDQQVIALGDSAFPMLLATLTWDGRRLTLAALHPVPPRHPAGSALRDRQLALAAAQLATLDGPRVVLGDFNATPFSAALRAFEQHVGVVNAARGHGLQPTWNARRYPFGIAIDHVLITPDLRALDRRVGPAVGSDHFPLSADLMWRD